MKRIIVMDDSELFLEVVGAALQAAGYDVAFAQDLAQLAEVRECGPSDLVLMDVQMPEAFGEDVAHAMRHTYGISAPIYLLSALDDADLAERVEWARVDGFISKHLGVEAIVNRVRSIVPVDA